MYEYMIRFYAVAYYDAVKGDIIEKTALPFDPHPESLFDNPLYINDMNRLGREGWELVSVVPLLRGCYNEGAGYGYSLTAGYNLFWRRKIA